MLTDMKDFLRTTWARAMRSNEEVPMTGYAQTKLSWARRATSYDELPAIYHDRMKALLGDRPLPHAVLTPTFLGHIRRENERLVFSLDDQLYIWERIKSDLKCTRYALADIHSVERGMVLLYSWIEVSGIASDGVLTTSILKFNSVTDWLFAPFIHEIRGATGDLANVDQEAEIQKFDSLVQLNFKFRNYARRSLMPGEKVIGALWQPELRNKLLTILGRSFYRTIATTHMLILTDRELIIVREDEDSPRWRGDSRHGGVWVYVPLGKITSIVLTDKENDLLALSICLPQNDCIESLFAASQKQDLDRFLGQFEKVTPRITVGYESVR